MNTNPKILIVDDSQELLGALKFFLESKLYEVRIIKDTKLLVTELVSNKPDVMMLDIFLNGMGNGLEICKSLKLDVQTKDIAIILMSSDYKILEKYKEYLADAMISKPFKLAELIQLIDSLS
jgi:CheY-like chemotaxis protein